MSDLLNSIIQSMEVPPDILNPEDRKRLKAAKEASTKANELQKRKLAHFRQHLHGSFSKFMKATNVKLMKFRPMSKPFRAIIHEEAVAGGLLSYSFGEDSIDRHVIVWKREFAPCEEELACRRSGEQWTEEKANQAAMKINQEQELKTRITESAELSSCCSSGNKTAGYMQKYQKILSRAAAYDEESEPACNSSYGCVPVELKQDQRTIEEVLAANKAKKRHIHIINELPVLEKCAKQENL